MGTNSHRSHDRPSGRTLGQLIDNKMALVAICRRCKHQRVLYPANYSERFGHDCPAIALRHHLRCSSCGARAANLHESAR
jgi:ribosomal protein L37E